MILKSTLYLNSDRTLVVKEGDERAAFLLGRAGQDLPEKVAKKYGLLKEKAEPDSETTIETRDPDVEHRESVVLRKVKTKIKK